MNLKMVPCLFVLLASLSMVPNAAAQNSGIRVAIAPPALPPQQPQRIIQTPVQPFVAAPVQSFGFGQTPITTFGFGVTPHMVPPIITTSYSPIFSQFPSHFTPFAMPFAGPGVAGNGITIIVPNGTVFTKSTVIYQQPAVQSYNLAPGATLPPTFVPPAMGTPRTQIMQQFGTPLTSVITPVGETLFFRGGIQIFIRDDKVARPD